MTSLAGPLIRNGRFLSLNPATGLAPSDIRSMVRSLVICLTHASEVRKSFSCLCLGLPFGQSRKCIELASSKEALS